MPNIWFGGSALLFIVMVVQSIMGKYEDQLQEVWSWFMPLILPSLSLMLGVMGATALASKKDARRVKTFFFRLSNNLSWFYFLILTATILLEPLAKWPGIQLFTLSNYWLGPLQGLVVAAIGVLFAAQEQKEKRSTQ